MPQDCDGIRFRPRCGNAVWRSRSPRGNGFGNLRRNSFTAAESEAYCRRREPEVGFAGNTSIHPSEVSVRQRLSAVGMWGWGSRLAPARGWSWETLYEAASRAARRLAILVAQLGDAAGVLELLLRGPCHMPRAAVLPPMRLTSMVETMTSNVAMTSMTAGTTVGIRRSSPRRVGHRGCGPHRWTTHYIFEGPRQHAVARYPAVTRYSYPSQRSGSRQAKA